MSLVALQQGWGAPVLEKILRWESANFSEIWSENIRDYAQKLTSIRFTTRLFPYRELRLL
jgi:hypothetical protein